MPLKSALAKSLFTQNVNANLNGVFLKPNPEGDFYIKLAAACNAINTMLTNFSNGNISAVMDSLTPQNYLSLALVFNGLRQSASKYPNYELIRTSIAISLQNLSQGVNQYLILLETKSRLAVAQEQASILSDMTKLQAYLDSLKAVRTLFNPSSQSIIKAKIKPQYATYIKMYGYPPSGIFDIDKLAPILNSMTAAGQKIIV